MAERLFNEKEVREILKRTSAIQSSSSLSDKGGISLAELLQTGSELGFDPVHIELAAKQLGAKSPSRSGLFGARIVLDQTFEAEVTPDDWLGMVGVIQRYHKDAGVVAQRGSNYDWAGSEEGASLAITVNVRNGQSRIRVESNRWMGVLMASIFFPLFTFIFTKRTFVGGHSLVALLILAVSSALFLFVIRQFRLNHVHSVTGLMERLVDEVGSNDSVQSLVKSPLEDRLSTHVESSLQA